MCAPLIAATQIGREHHAQTPHDGHLPQAALRPGEHRRMHRPAAEEHQDERAEEFGEREREERCSWGDL